ncbi:beta-lactamase family protein [Mycobacterium yunnanensis]|uniref:Beta-lactamase family protein n=1 Tax=Mycobacterium yunnanensis TaxID=368477 RepID=A0A9X2YYW5_9MYCO|nr:serine hydrolase domain-containing protein [Mycobacterium yunnanensis]MCV7420056.1 beta-lactamase family protein [Mycobacterium yunnanensis]
MSPAARPPGLGPATGDFALVARIEPLLRSASLTDRVGVAHLRRGDLTVAHFGAQANTVYEIGSVTKTMTASLFADAVTAGEIDTDTTLGSVFAVTGQADAVTMEELVSHRSGLPRVTGRRRDLARAVVAALRHRNPYVADVRALLAAAGDAKLVDRGTFSYSNLGMALLGQALARRGGTEYPDLLDRRLFGRLSMSRSTTPLTARDQPPGALTGWSASGHGEEAWSMNAYAPAGGVRSTLDDMARYAAALLDGAAPGVDALEPRWDAGDGRRVGYAWFVDRIDGATVTWHNGTTGGFSSMIALDRDRAAAVVILANTVAMLDEIAIRLLLERD